MIHIDSCPNCQSRRIVTRNYAKKAGGVLGFILGSASGAGGTLGGAEIGASLGLVAGPPGVVTGAVIGAILGGMAAAVTCSKLGAMVDERILDNLECLDCGYSFSSKGP